MGKNQSASNITNIIRQDASGNIAFMSGSTMLMSLNNTGQMSGSAPAVSAVTASYADNFTVTGNLTAQTLVVQTITSSVDFVTGSTRFGSFLTNTHVFSGSVAMNPGGLFVSGSGQVGIGTTSPIAALHVEGAIGEAPAANGVLMGVQSGYPIIHLNAASAYGGVIDFSTSGTDYKGRIEYSNTDNYMRFGTNGAERLRITSGGNVGIGTSTVNSKFIVVDNAEPNASGNITSGTQFAASISGGLASLNVGAYDNGSSIRYGYLRTAFSDAAQVGAEMRFYTGATERMRITAGGFAKMSNDGTYYQGSSPAHELRSSTGGEWNTIMSSTAANPYGLLIGLNPNISNTGNEFISAYVANFSTLRFRVTSNGGIHNFQANDVNLSDERTKKDIFALESYWDKFKAIEIVKFKYKDQSHDDYNIGVIAQQVEEVAPEFVETEGWDNRNMPEDGLPLKAVYTTDLYHAAIKVLQEAMAKIEEQQTQIESLKAEINALK
jgi:hypothetical protein